ncbi:hypothetical protein P389DRAFT_210745 [Cystobasidium minutum MCA 4210]|uniref:uncharacterized protein n=1 Tax=Cystobasidium minutum MCA 4210 TaxID=1397322 RepID=UPI0034CDD645|eukprot:jgi/Rhomi1/210745/estExt_Genemark1.C_4_t10314
MDAQPDENNDDDQQQQQQQQQQQPASVPTEETESRPAATDTISEEPASLQKPEADPASEDDRQDGPAVAEAVDTSKSAVQKLASEEHEEAAEATASSLPGLPARSRGVNADLPFGSQQQEAAAEHRMETFDLSSQSTSDPSQSHQTDPNPARLTSQEPPIPIRDLSPETAGQEAEDDDEQGSDDDDDDDDADASPSPLVQEAAIGSVTTGLASLDEESSRAERELSVIQDSQPSFNQNERPIGSSSSPVICAEPSSELTELVDEEDMDLDIDDLIPNKPEGINQQKEDGEAVHPRLEDARTFEKETNIPAKVPRELSIEAEEGPGRQDAQPLEDARTCSSSSKDNQVLPLSAEGMQTSTLTIEESDGSHPPQPTPSEECHTSDEGFENQAQKGKDAEITGSRLPEVASSAGDAIPDYVLDDIAHNSTARSILDMNIVDDVAVDSRSNHIPKNATEVHSGTGNETEAGLPASHDSVSDDRHIDELPGVEAESEAAEDAEARSELVADKTTAHIVGGTAISRTQALERLTEDIDAGEEKADDIPAARIDTTDAAAFVYSTHEQLAGNRNSDSPGRPSDTSDNGNWRLHKSHGASATTTAPPAAPASDVSAAPTTEGPAEAEDTRAVSATTSLDTPARTSTFRPLSRSTPSALPRLHRSSSKGQTYVGGMLASNKAMKPFRSPVISRKETNSEESSGPSTSTPSKTVSIPGIKSALGRTSLLSTSVSASSTSETASSPGLAGRTTFKGPSFTFARTPNTPGNAALNKPFKSLVSRKDSTENVSSSNIADMVDSEGQPMSSIQLAAALPKLERRLALLKDARRHRIASEKGLDTADNTDHIKELSLKWLEKGREAAEMLWALVKDSIDTSQADAQHGDSGYGFGFEKDKPHNSSNWAWDTADTQQSRIANGRRNGNSFRETGTVERLRQQVSDAIDALPEEERKAVHEQLEEEGDDLPDLDPEQLVARLQKKRASSSTNNGRDAKRAHLEYDDDDDEGDIYGAEEAGHDPDDDEPNEEDNDALSDTAHDVDAKAGGGSDDDDEMEVEDDPSKGGMSKMLNQCGIDIKTFGWNPAQDEWDVLQ